jgi:hypothetical protein
LGLVGGEEEEGGKGRSLDTTRPSVDQAPKRTGAGTYTHLLASHKVGRIADACVMEKGRM